MLSLITCIYFPSYIFIIAQLLQVTGTCQVADLIPKGVIEGLSKQAYITLKLVQKRLFIQYKALVVERRIIYSKTLEVRRRITYYKTLVVKKKEEDRGLQQALYISRGEILGFSIPIVLLLNYSLINLIKSQIIIKGSSLYQLRVRVRGSYLLSISLITSYNIKGRCVYITNRTLLSPLSNKNYLI